MCHQNLGAQPLVRHMDVVHGRVPSWVSTSPPQAASAAASEPERAAELSADTEDEPEVAEVDDATSVIADLLVPRLAAPQGSAASSPPDSAVSEAPSDTPAPRDDESLGDHPPLSALSSSSPPDLLELSSDELDVLHGSLERVREGMERLEARVVDERRRARSELQEAAQARTTAEARIAALEEALDREHASSARSESALASVQRALEEADQRTQGVAQDLTRLQEERHQLEGIRESEESRIEQQQEELRKAGELLTSAREMIKRETEEIASLRTSLREAQERTVELESELQARTTTLRQAAEALRLAVGRAADNRAVADALSVDLAEAREKLASSESDLQRTRAALRAAPVAQEAASPRGPMPVPCVPVGFLGPEHRTPFKEAFFALGHDEALEQMLKDTLHRWRSSGLPLFPFGSPEEGVGLALRGDPEHREMRVLPTGAVLIRLGSSELDLVRSLPRFVQQSTNSHARLSHSSPSNLPPSGRVGPPSPSGGLAPEA